MAGELIRREALERIIQRAAELQAGEQDIGEGLTEPELLALGQDVGIPSRYLRQALLEEQTRPPAEARGGVLAWLVGPGRLSAQRVVAGEPAVIDRALGTWMQAEELLQVKRRYADHTTWEPKVGAFASIQRALGAGGRRFGLGRATGRGGPGDSARERLLPRPAGRGRAQRPQATLGRRDDAPRLRDRGERRPLVDGAARAVPVPAAPDPRSGGRCDSS